MYKSLMAALLLALFAQNVGAEDLNSLINPFVEEQIKECDERHKASKMPADEGEEKEVYPEMAYKTEVAFLKALLKSKDIELKRLYVLNIWTSELEAEKQFLNFLEGPEKKEAEKKLKVLQGKIAKLNKS